MAPTVFHEHAPLSQPAGARVAFVYMTLAWSVVHRGSMPAASLGAAHFSCEQAARFTGHRFDVVIHLKHACRGALSLGAHHVFDHIDAKDSQLDGFHAMSRNFSGEIMGSGPHLDHLCRTPICTVIPHHYHLPCKPRLDRRGKSAIGLIGWNRQPALQQEFRAAGITTVVEPRSSLLRSGVTKAQRERFRAASCGFYSDLGVAITWSYPGSWYELNQRFTNSIYLGIPTIGYAHQVSWSLLSIT